MALGMSGCAMMDQIKNPSKYNGSDARKAAEYEKSPEAKKAKEEEEAKQRAIAERQAAALNIGTKISVFIEAFGTARNLGASKNIDILYYDLTPYKSYKFFFEKKALTGWEPDYDRENQRRDTRYQAEMEQLEHQRRVDQANSETRQAWQNLGNTLNQMSMQNQIEGIKNNQNNYSKPAQPNTSGRVLVNQPGR